MPPLHDTFPELGPVFGPIAAELWRLFGPTVLFFLQWAFLCGVPTAAGVPTFGPITINLTGFWSFLTDLFLEMLACCGAVFGAVASGVGLLLFARTRRRRRRA